MQKISNKSRCVGQVLLVPLNSQVWLGYRITGCRNLGKAQMGWWGRSTAVCMEVRLWVGGGSIPSWWGLEKGRETRTSLYNSSDWQEMAGWSYASRSILELFNKRNIKDKLHSLGTRLASALLTTRMVDERERDSWPRTGRNEHINIDLKWT